MRDSPRPSASPQVLCDARVGERNMRTTLTIDDDILAVAKHLAQRDRTSVGKVICALARQGLAHEPAGAQTVRNGVQLLPRRRGSAPVTPELVNQLRDDLP